MYARAVNGSAQKGGNTEFLLKEVLGELKKNGWKTELEKVGGTAIRDCSACQKCFENCDNQYAIKKDNVTKSPLSQRLQASWIVCFDFHRDNDPTRLGANLYMQGRLLHGIS